MSFVRHDAGIMFALQGGNPAPGRGGWAKGTGYGGNGSLYGMAPQNNDEERMSRQAAGLRQQVVDEHLQKGITSICNCLERHTGQANGMLPCCAVPCTSV